MSKLTFYHQKRKDGGVRTGVTADDERILEDYHSPRKPTASALLWFVDVRFKNVPAPSAPAKLKDWLLERGGDISGALKKNRRGPSPRQ